MGEREIGERVEREQADLVRLVARCRFLAVEDGELKVRPFPFLPRPLAYATGALVGSKVIVAGGGLAGLSCAFELMERGHDVTLLEAARRMAGLVGWDFRVIGNPPATPRSRTASARATRSSSSGLVGRGAAWRTSSQPRGAVIRLACPRHRSQECGSRTVASGPTTAVESE